MLPTFPKLAFASPIPPPPKPYQSPYTAKKSWPPDFTKLSPKHQFRFERRYRRRAKLKYARPTWTKATKLAQYGAIGFVMVYGVLFMDWQDSRNPFQGIRAYFRGATEERPGVRSGQVGRPGPKSDPSRPPQ